MAKLSVLLADDSDFWLRHLPPILERDPDIRVAGMAAGARSGVARYEELRPDVVVADLFLGRRGRSLAGILVEERDAVVVGTGPASRREETLAEADAHGVPCVLKPPATMCSGLDSFARELTHAVKEARAAPALAEFRRLRAAASISRPTRAWTDTVRIVALAASTGGTQALEEVLAGLPEDFPAGLVLVQHLSHGLSEALAERINLRSRIKVEVAGTGLPVIPGRAILAPDGRHLVVRKGPYGLMAVPDDGRRPTLYKPSADVLFTSVAETCGERALGVVLTGMGDDGCRGLSRIKERGGVVLAQDAGSSVVFGMPGAAIACGAADVAVPLDEMADEIMRRCSRPVGADRPAPRFFL